MTEQTILILDHFEPHYNLGMPLYEAMQASKVNCYYLNLREIPKVTWRALNNAYRKLCAKEIRLNKIDTNWLKIFLQQKKITTIFTVGIGGNYLNEHSFRKLKKDLSIKIIAFDTDAINFSYNLDRFKYFIDEELPVYDYIFSHSRKMVDFLQNLGYHKTSWLPFAWQPIDLAAEEIPAVKQYDLCFIGHPWDLRRMNLINQLADFNIALVGSRWIKYLSLLNEKLHKKIITEESWQQEAAKIIHDTKIVINISNSHYCGVESGVNLRIFETTALGGFLLTDYNTELDALFDVGSEIEAYRNQQELLDKINYYLTHEEKRQSIAASGQLRFLKDHTWHARIPAILAEQF